MVTSNNIQNLFIYLVGEQQNSLLRVIFNYPVMHAQGHFSCTFFLVEVCVGGSGVIGGFSYFASGLMKLSAEMKKLLTWK